MQRETGDIKCWHCGKWITKKGNLCPYCGQSKEKSRQLVEAREDRFITLSAIWFSVALLLAVALWVIYGAPLAFCVAGPLLFLPGLVVVYFWTGMVGG
jgi:predicted nucleic acid-binding Zn ribbon protein